HAGIDLVALGEALGTLFGAVAAEVRAADEGLHSVVFDLDAAVLDRGDLDGDDVAALHARDRLGKGITLDRLDRQRDALLLDINIGHHRLDAIALAVVLDRLLARAVPVEIRQMHHAVDVALEADEQAELGDVLHLALNLGA